MEITKIKLANRTKKVVRFGEIDLSVRTGTVLIKDGYAQTKDGLEAFLMSRDTTVPNLGRKTVQEILDSIEGKSLVENEILDFWKGYCRR